MDQEGIGIGAIIAVLVAGMGMGYYFSRMHLFRKLSCSRMSQFITMSVIGLSFLIPIAIEQMAFEDLSMSPETWGIVLGLWLFYSFVTTESNWFFSTRKKQLHN